MRHVLLWWLVHKLRMLCKAWHWASTQAVPNMGFRYLFCLSTAIGACPAVVLLLGLVKLSHRLFLSMISVVGLSSFVAVLGFVLLLVQRQAVYSWCSNSCSCQAICC